MRNEKSRGGRTQDFYSTYFWLPHVTLADVWDRFAWHQMVGRPLSTCRAQGSVHRSSGKRPVMTTGEVVSAVFWGCVKISKHHSNIIQLQFPEDPNGFGQSHTMWSRAGHIHMRSEYGNAVRVLVSWLIIYRICLSNEPAWWHLSYIYVVQSSGLHWNGSWILSRCYTWPFTMSNKQGCKIIL